MPNNQSRDSISETRHQVIDDSKRIAEDVKQLYSTIRHDNALGRIYQDNPYAVIAAAAGIGYVLGGGLFTPFTRRMMRVGMKALVLPVAAAQVKSFTQGNSLDGTSILGD